MAHVSTTPNFYNIEPFNGDDFYTWKYRMELLFEELSLWDVVMNEDKDDKDWRIKNRKALGLLARYLSNEKLSYVMSSETAASAWKCLCKAHEPNDFIQMYSLRRKFYALKKTDDISMTSHIETLRTIMRKLQAIGVEVGDDEASTALLMSLPDSFETLITALGANAAKSLTLDEIISQVLREDDRKKESQGAKREDGNVFLAARKMKFDGNSEFTCFYCGKPGHFKRDCRKLQSDKERRSSSRDVKPTSEERLFYAALKSVSDKRSREEWFVDTGATDHMSSNKNLFVSLTNVKEKYISVAKKSETIKVVGVGDIILEGLYGSSGPRQRLRNVLYAPDLDSNLLSVSRIVDAGYKVCFKETECSLVGDDGEEIPFGSRSGQLWKSTSSLSNVHALMTQSPKASVEIWHKRLGHLGQKGMDMLNDKGQINVDGAMDVMSLCSGCLQGKQHRKPFPKDNKKVTTRHLELIHTDVCGPMQVASKGGARFYVEFVDDCSRKTWVYLLHEKSEVLQRFIDFKAQVENESGERIKALRSDNGGEFTSHAFKDFLRIHGIKQQTSAPRTPEQNGVAERNNRTIMETARCMLHGASMDVEFWAEAVVTATYLRNISPKVHLNAKSPEEIWSKRKPDISHLKIFGCRAYALIPKETRKKLDSKATECVMLGYADGSKAYRLYEIATGKILISRDVQFDETILGLEEKPHIHHSQVEGTNGDIDTIDPVGALDNSQIGDENNIGSDNELETTNDTFVDAQDISDDYEEEEYRRSTRQRFKPVEYWKSNAEKIRASIAQLSEPTTVKEALVSEEAQMWRKAMDEEYAALQKNETYEISELPKGRRAIGCKWVFKVKLNADGSVDKYKARLVAKGYSQKEGIDYSETFAPVVKYVTIRCLLAISAVMDYEIQQMDVKAAFLNGDLEEEIYMQQPEGYVLMDDQQKVWRLRKALYGLKQAPRSWYNKLDQCLDELGLCRAQADQSVYVKRCNGDVLIIAIYVDDMLLAGNNIEMINDVKKKLSDRFDMKDLGDVHWILGMEVVRDRRQKSISLNQCKYIETVLERYGMESCKTVSTPMDINAKFPTAKEHENVESKVDLGNIPYQSVVGSLMYAMVATRPDIAYGVGVLSRYIKDPNAQHWIAAKRILRYLQGTKHIGLTYGSGSNQVVGYCDADYAADIDQRKSTTGYVFLLNGGVVSWSSKLQQTVALSTTEAEYMALAHAAKEAIWLRLLLSEFGIEQEGATIINEDNQGCINLAKNPISHGRTKHIDVRYHFLREKVDENIIQLQYCKTDDMLADSFTKALGRNKYERIRNSLGIVKLNNISPSGSVKDN